MTDDRASPTRRDALAAEYALGVLDGDELAQARALAATDPRFRARGRALARPAGAAARRGRAGRRRRDALWQRIDGAIGGERGPRQCRAAAPRA